MPTSFLVKNAYEFGADRALQQLGLPKEAGLLQLAQSLKQNLLKPIPGTKPWVIPTEHAVSQSTAAVAPRLRKPVKSTKWSGGNIYDVSAQAREMGL